MRNRGDSPLSNSIFKVKELVVLGFICILLTALQLILNFFHVAGSEGNSYKYLLLAPFQLWYLVIIHFPKVTGP